MRFLHDALLSQMGPVSSATLKDMAKLSLPLLVSVFVSQAVRASHPASVSNAVTSLPSFDFLTAASVSTLALLLLFLSLKRHGEEVARLLIAGTTILGTLSGLILWKSWVDSSRAFAGPFYLLATPVGFTGIYLSFRSYYGTLSYEKRSILIIGSLTFLGSLIGTIFSLTFITLLLLALSIVDLFLVESDFLKKGMGEGEYGAMMTTTTVSMEKYTVGFGDFAAYSILAASSIRIGIYAAIATLTLIMVGALATFRMARFRTRAPGLPLPIWLGLLPIVLGLLVV